MRNSTVCKNCNNQFKGDFCNHCGQPADTHRLNLHHIWHDIQHGLFHFDNGIFYTISQLLTRPGYSIKEYVQGKRVRHYKPLSFVVVLATVYGLLYHFLMPGLSSEAVDRKEDDILAIFMKTINWSLHHFAYATFIMIVSATCASYLVFKKQAFNLAEHLVLNTYYRGLVLLISLLLFPLLYLIYRNGADGPRNFVPFFQLADLAVMYWCYSQFFSSLGKWRSLGLTLLTYLFMSVMNNAIAVLVGLFDQ